MVTSKFVRMQNLQCVVQRVSEEVDDAGQHVRLGQVEERVQNIDSVLVKHQEAVWVFLTDILTEI